MSDAEILVSEAYESETGEDIIDALPSWMPRTAETGNFKLLDTVGRAFDRVDGDLNDLDNATNVQTAETVEQIHELSKLVDTPPKTNEGVDTYRLRSLSEFQVTTTEGTAEHVLGNAGSLLEIEISQIRYKRLGRGEIELQIPSRAINQSAINDSDFANLINKHCAAGYTVSATVRGTFTYLSPSAYSGSSTSYDKTNLNSDATKGHDGLDVNGDPKDTGGTYAGLIH